MCVRCAACDAHDILNNFKVLKKEGVLLSRFVPLEVSSKRVGDGDDRLIAQRSDFMSLRHPECF